METLKKIPFLRTDALTVLAMYLFIAPVTWPLVSLMVNPPVSIVITALIAFLLPLAMFKDVMRMVGDRLEQPKERLFLVALIGAFLELAVFKMVGIRIDPGHDIGLAAMLLPILGGVFLAFVVARIFRR